MTTPPIQPRCAVLLGRDYPVLGDYEVLTVGSSLAVGTTAGATAKPQLRGDPNEDAGAVAAGPRASLLVIADAHFGADASEVAVESVVAALGDDPPPPALSDDDLVSLVFEAGVAVVQETTRATCPHPESRTTLALALATSETVQWAAIGDSCVLLVAHGSATRLDTPRPAYLGNRFTVHDVAAAMTRGRASPDAQGCVVLATDGLIGDVEAVVCAAAADAQTAREVAEALLGGAVRAAVGDAATVAVAMGRSADRA